MSRCTQALVHLEVAQAQMLDSDDPIIRGHVDAAARLLREHVAMLRGELDSDQCRRDEAARQRVRQDLDDTLAKLDEVEPHVGGAA